MEINSIFASGITKVIIWHDPDHINMIWIMPKGINGARNDNYLELWIKIILLSNLTVSTGTIQTYNYIKDAPGNYVIKLSKHCIEDRMCGSGRRSIIGLINYFLLE